jgi:hypothetical protein
MQTPNSNSDGQNPAGDCFLAAFNTLFDMMENPESPELVLVHGNVARLPQVDPVNHAWVENKLTIFDHSNGIQTQMAKNRYYSILQITGTHRYTPMEALRMSIEHSHYGPWP